MDVATLESHIHSALTHRTGKPSHRPRDDEGRSWQADYGPGRFSQAVNNATRLDDGISRRGDGDSGSIGKDRLDARDSWSGKALWREMMATLCSGTKVFAVCLGIVAFIAVV